MRKAPELTLAFRQRVSQTRNTHAHARTHTQTICQWVSSLRFDCEILCDVHKKWRINPVCSAQTSAVLLYAFAGWGGAAAVSTNIIKCVLGIIKLEQTFSRHRIKCIFHTHVDWIWMHSGALGAPAPFPARNSQFMPVQHALWCLTRRTTRGSRLPHERAQMAKCRGPISWLHASDSLSKHWTNTRVLCI